MGPVIRNFRSLYTPEGRGARLIGLLDNPPTCTMTYSEIYPGKSSAHHIHPWEHEIFIIKGAGALVCDGMEYPVKEGDAVLILGNVDHYTLNNGGQGVIRRIVINPLSAARSGGVSNVRGKGTGQPPVVRNYLRLDRRTGNRIIGTRDAAPNYTMHYSELAPGQVTYQDSGGHTHPWEHEAYILEGRCTLQCDRKDYMVAEGDAVLVPTNVHHQWRSTSDLPMKRVTFNPISAEAHGA